MMKYFSLIILSLLFSYESYSQEFRSGIIAGLCVSQVDGDNMSGYNRFGPQGGLFANYVFADKNAFQLELLYCMRGSATPSEKEPVVMGEIRSQYIDIALYYKYLFNDKINAKIGIVPSHLIDYSYTCNGVKQDNVAEFRKLGLTFSIGGEYFFDDNWFAIGDFNYSLISIREGKAEFSDMGSYYYRFIFDNGQYYNYFKFSIGHQF